MKVRYKDKPNITGTSSKFNTSSPAGEVIMYFDDFENLGGADSVYISDLEVYIKEKWEDLSKAFDKNDLITDNYNTTFFEPENEEEKKRGYRLTKRDLAELNASIEDTSSAPRFY